MIRMIALGGVSALAQRNGFPSGAHYTVELVPEIT